MKFEKKNQIIVAGISFVLASAIGMVYLKKKKPDLFQIIFSKIPFLKSTQPNKSQINQGNIPAKQGLIKLKLKRGK